MRHNDAMTFVSLTARWSVDTLKVSRRGNSVLLQVVDSEDQMAYAVTHFFPGGTKDQYEASIGAVHPSRDKLPKGQIFHAAGPSAGGWMVVAIHDSREGWENFRNTVLMPALGKGVEGGFASPPEETVFEVYNLQG